MKKQLPSPICVFTLVGTAGAAVDNAAAKAKAKACKNLESKLEQAKETYKSLTNQITKLKMNPSDVYNPQINILKEKQAEAQQDFADYAENYNEKCEVR